MPSTPPRPAMHSDRDWGLGEVGAMIFGALRTMVRDAADRYEREHDPRGKQLKRDHANIHQAAAEAKRQRRAAKRRKVSDAT